MFHQFSNSLMCSCVMVMSHSSTISVNFGVAPILTSTLDMRYCMINQTITIYYQVFLTLRLTPEV